MFKVIAIDNGRNPYASTVHPVNISSAIGGALYMSEQEAADRIPGYIADLKELAGYGDHIIRDVALVVAVATDADIARFYGF